MNKFYLDYTSGTEQIALNGKKVCLGSRVQAVLRDDAGEFCLYTGTVTTAARAGAAGTALWVTFQGFHAFSVEYLRGSGVPARFI